MDEEVANVWRIHEAGGGPSWPIDLTVCRLLDQHGAWGGVVALRDATRVETGERLFLFAMDGAAAGVRRRLLVTAESEAHGWEPVDWVDAEEKARASPMRRRMTWIERVKLLSRAA